MANSHEGEQSRIMKNTVMLYIRMAVIMLASLYMSRVVLNVLGEQDYGIYNIVGSVVVSLTFIQNALISATQRFLSYEIGKGNLVETNRVFSMSMNIHILFTLVVVIVLEFAGVWFVNNILNIPADRMFAANVVLQFSIATYCGNMLRIPYNAVIISHESMNVYAVISIVEAFLKLALAFVLMICRYDKLIMYAALLFLITLIVNSLYILYCKKTYPNVCNYRYINDKCLFKKMTSFLGWNMFGGVSSIATSEGPNYFINIYLGVTVNAALGLAKQVSSAVYQFTSNFQSAFNPQIVKAYAQGDKTYLFDLINKTSQISFYLLFIIAFPVILCSDVIFDLWLVDVPRYAVEFCILIMVAQIISAFSSPMWMVVHATGNIKKYQVTLSAINLLILPISWAILALGLSPVYIVLAQVFINIMIFMYRLWFLYKYLDFCVMSYIKRVLIKNLILVLVIFPVPLLTHMHTDGIGGMISTFISAVIITGIVFYKWGIDAEYKEYFKNFIFRLLKMIKK